MVFSSLLFIFIFLPITLAVYYICPKKFRNIVISIVSLIFYAWGEPIYIIIMIFSTIFDYTNGRLIYENKNNKKTAKLILIFSIAINLGLLCFFKYYGFIVNNINGLFNLEIKINSMPLPLGISFYTFQTMSYVIDVYRGIVPAQKNFLNFVTYVYMFPQLLAGPIVKYRDVEKEITDRKESIKLFIIGLFKKVFIANNVGVVWSAIKGLQITEMSVASAWIGIIAFTFQIYFDFSGYSDMARGIAMMFGFQLPINFNYPYTSKSITEFWRRWHMTLGGWFREYVYIPLGGNKTTNLKRYRNIFIVWFLTGLWHGANWNFILWGLYYGIFVTLEKMFLLRWLDKLPSLVRNLYSILAVIIGWALFEIENIPKLLEFLGVMFGIGTKKFIDKTAVYYLYTNAAIFVIMILGSTQIPLKILETLKLRFEKVNIIIFTVMYVSTLFICTAYLVNQSYNPFLYFRF
ncbi:peptidoglycan O-acetyltransferase [Clostridium puniceum]|uniref:Peptidoglycan O-acetyltransferase n=1 Tax=Clostridium puniceum TaxID=29367 RepID=A0A1S8TXB8_9CLOT|nr:MBOAT family O-acyltransferase [Clostridium puniceum]OOM82354.1 peptidoglycan O-acetyltransferase [Clostridium puniceum]